MNIDTPTRRGRAFALAAILAGAVAITVSGCSFSTPPKKTPATRPHPLVEGETIGKIVHLPGGTAVASSVITLLGVTCTNGQVVVTTNNQTIRGKMDCAQIVPQATLERFYGQVVGISYARGRLRIESPSAGTIDLPVTEAASVGADAPP